VAAELQRAGDPQVARVEPDDLVARVDDPAVAGPRAAQRDGHDVTHRCDPVLLRHFASRPQGTPGGDVLYFNGD
jgi:hypothetical protein